MLIKNMNLSFGILYEELLKYTLERLCGELV